MWNIKKKSYLLGLYFQIQETPKQFDVSIIEKAKCMMCEFKVKRIKRQNNQILNAMT